MASQNRLHATKFEDLIRRRGRVVKWREAVICSCWNLNSGQPQYECKACKGLGYTYADPIEDLALIMSITHSKEFEDTTGVFEIGDAIMTVGLRIPEVHPVTGNVITTVEGRKNPLFHVGMYDVITLTDDEYKTSEILVRDTDLYRRPADTLLNDDVVDVLSVAKCDPVTGVVTHYAYAQDYEVEGSTIKWLDDGLQPAPGEQYAVQYTHRPVFTVLTQLPTPRYQDGQDLPKKVVLRYRTGGFSIGGST